MNKKLFFLTLTMISLVLLGSCGSNSSVNSPIPSESPPPQPSEPGGNLAPDFEAQTLSGEKISLSALRGKIVILNFWATWCPPCRQEIPELNTFWEKNKEKVAFYGIEIMEPREEVEQFLKENTILYPIVLDSEQEKSVSELYRVSLVPTTVIIGENGEILQVVLGSTTASNLSSYLP
ncbi:MAG: TlpA family protein disulfide reductase [Caldiserica bacterium]|jgi:thiol-disulfide isomerase/thioredoxin|nr:TlpA family protein disulfide reductase [Caldisericota bacterium]MDH7561954.1 TlpA disulfide reductase family protein [Caldisericota bacterium]